MPIASSDIQLRQAGVSGLGGAISNTAAPGFGTVSPADSEAGLVDYVCEYVRNGNTSLMLSGAKLWLSANTPSPSTMIEVGLGTSGINGTEQTVASSRTAPVDVTFSLAANEASALLLGDLPPLGSRAVWYRRTVTAGAAALNQDTYTRTVVGESPDDGEEGEDVEVGQPLASVYNVWTGTPTTDGAVISAKMIAAGDTRVMVSTSANFANPSFSSVVAPDANYRIAKHQLSGLQPDTDYYYAIMQGGGYDNVYTGRFRTLPTRGAPKNFRLAIGCCSNHTSPNQQAWETIRNLSPRPAALLHLGDITYSDTAGANESDHIGKYDLVMSTATGFATRHQTMREMSTVYMRDDHDFGPNDSYGYDANGAKTAYRDGSTAAFRTRVPALFHTDTVTDVVDHSFVIGRCMVIMSDLRGDRWHPSSTAAGKTIMGAAQKQRFKDLIVQAKAENLFVLWCSSVTFVYGGWGAYADDIYELCDHIKAAGMGTRVVMACGDAHSMAYAASADFAAGGGAPIPVVNVGALHGNWTTKGTTGYTIPPVSQTAANNNTSNYLVMDVTDDGTTVGIRWLGKQADGDLTLLDVSFNLTVTNETGPPPDTTAPVLSNPTASATGLATATVSVSTNEANGTLYCLVSTSATATAATVKAGQQQAVSSVGTKSFNVSGLASGDTNYAHFLHRDASGNESGVARSAGFSTQAPPSVFEATGGTVREVDGFKEWEFLSSADMVVTSAGEVDYLAVGGGASGGAHNTGRGAGGGAGEPKQGKVTIPVGTHAIVIGEGGAPVTSNRGNNGGATRIGNLVEAEGGGAGGASTLSAGNGASGGGAGAGDGSSGPGSASPGKGNIGGLAHPSSVSAERAAGGGGGAGGPGGNAGLSRGGDGGDGVTVWGRTVAGGGGGAGAGTETGNPPHGAGKAGGSDGAHLASALPAAANTGSGGGGTWTSGKLSGRGGSGLVVIRRPV